MGESRNEPFNPNESDAEFVKELNRRLDELRSGRVKGIPAEKVMARLRAKYGNKKGRTNGPGFSPGRGVGE
jgi:hypothetical protein